MWALGNFATVDEVRRAVKDIVIVPMPLPGFGSTEGQMAPVHFFLRDQTGQSIVIEPIDGKLIVTDAPLGVMTNAPTYDWHMTNLNNYINLSVKDVASKQLGPVTLRGNGKGHGLLGPPGDFTPPSRFVRAALFSQVATPNSTAQDAVFAAFHILNQFDIPKGSVINGSVGKPVPEITEWTSMNDMENLRFYMRTHQDQSIRIVDLKEAMKDAKGKISVIDMQASEQPVSTEVQTMTGEDPRAE